MGKDKYLRYCTNCNHYNKSTGNCNYLNINVLDDSNEFNKFCDGKYLSLMKGKVIKPDKERLDFNTEDEIVTVFSSNSNSLFQYAKSILDDNKIEYISSGDYLNSLEGFVYSSQIKVFTKDEKVSRKLLIDITQSVHEPSGKTDKMIKSFIGQWGIVLIFLFLISILLIFYFLNN